MDILDFIIYAIPAIMFGVLLYVISYSKKQNADIPVFTRFIECVVNTTSKDSDAECFFNSMKPEAKAICNTGDFRGYVK